MVVLRWLRGRIISRSLNLRRTISFINRLGHSQQAMLVDIKHVAVGAVSAESVCKLITVYSPRHCLVCTIANY